ncbi:unnamed protein product [Camellia sinensis]
MEKILERLRNKKGATMADAWIEDVFEANDDDLSSWELINQSDDENEDYSFDDDDDDDDDLYVLESLSSDFSTQSPPPDLIDHTIDHVREDFIVKHVSIDQQYEQDFTKHVSIDQRYEYNDYENNNNNDDDNDDEEEEEEEDYDLDDELVPKSVSDRFGRQRMRKLGKRAYPKMNKSKRLPYYYSRPGCVHGKHGLGLQNIIV